jgi:hypothetical protein
MDVDHRRLNVRMAHERLHVRKREHLDGDRPERVPQVVKTKPRKTRALERVVEAAT